MPLDPDLATRVLRAALEQGGDEAEVFSEYHQLRMIGYEEAKVRSSSLNVSAGVAVRVVQGESQGLAFSESGRDADLLDAARQAARIAQAGGGTTPQTLQRRSVPDRYPVEVGLAAEPIDGRIALCRRMHDAAAAGDAAVAWVSCGLVDSERWIQVFRSDGIWAEDYQPMIRTTVSALFQDQGRRERGYTSWGRRGGYELLGGELPEQLAAEALRLGRLRLEAEACPAGSMSVVLAAGSAGVLIHEAVGHGLEADFNRRGVSAYAGQLGQPVASELVGIIDEGISPGERGSINVDDEGSPVDSTTLIENGVLRGYLTDRLNARLMNLPVTGNGRRDSYHSLPIPRMRITGMAAGEEDPDAIIRSVSRGLYAKTIGGGSVDISKGDYNFEVLEGYLIEDGRITRPVRGATLVGNGPETMRRVCAVAHDQRIDHAAYTCGKDGQGAPVSVFTPTFKVDELVVGGEQA